MNKRLKRMIEMGIISNFLIVIILLLTFKILISLFPVSETTSLAICTGIVLSFLMDLVKTIYWSKEEKFNEYKKIREEKILLSKDERNVMIKEKAGEKILNISLIIKIILTIILYFLKIFNIYEASWVTIGILLALVALEYWGNKYLVKIMENKY